MKSIKKIYNKYNLSVKPDVRENDLLIAKMKETKIYYIKGGNKMKKPKFNFNPDASKKEIQTAVDQIIEYVRGKSIQEWRIFHLSTIKLNRRYTEEEIEKQFDIFFCNGLSHPINKVELAYSSYDGLLSILPVHDDPKSTHESYFNFNTEEDPFENPEKHFSDIYKLWNQLKNL